MSHTAFTADSPCSYSSSFSSQPVRLQPHVKHILRSASDEQFYLFSSTVDNSSRCPNYATLSLLDISQLKPRILPKHGELLFPSFFKHVPSTSQSAARKYHSSNIALATHNYTLQFIAVHRWAVCMCWRLWGQTQNVTIQPLKSINDISWEAGPGTSPVRVTG